MSICIYNINKYYLTNYSFIFCIMDYYEYLLIIFYGNSIEIIEKKILKVFSFNINAF